ncbi:MAG: zinc-binding dehydrogenase [Caldilineaceae bacterium]
MKSSRMKGDSKVICIEEEAPVPGAGEVVIETRISALCGSEMKTYRGKGQALGNPGHEAAGVVVQLGEGVDTLQVGQRVGVSAISGCGHCEYCAKGQYTWCPNRKFYGNMHAERFLTAANTCHLLPDDLSWEVGVLVTGDGFGVPYHTSLKLRDPKIQTIAIFGMGPIGLGNLLMQRYLGREVIAVDISAQRLELAEELGATQIVRVREGSDVVAEIRRLTQDKGADACIEAVGRPETAKQCFSAVRTAGTVVFNGEQTAVELSPSEDFIRRDITAVGSWYYHFNEYPEMLALYRAGLPIDKLITHHIPLADIGEGYRLMDAGQTGKVLIHYKT